MAMKLSLAPVPFFWEPKRLQDFYDEIAESPIDIVYLGETVCYKRRGLRLPDWLAIGDMLEAHGKEVVLSSLVLVDGEAEIKATRRLCLNGRFLIEANDMSAVSLACGSAFVAGATLNIYNEEALKILAENGAIRFVAALELDGAALTTLRAAHGPSIECEVLAFGRPALAYSARCFSARSIDRGKDECEWICEGQAAGIPIATQDDVPFLTINGPQVHSAQRLNYLTELDTLGEAGVDIVRIMPELEHCLSVIEAFRAVLDRRLTAEAAIQGLEGKGLARGTNGYWRGRAGQAACP